MRRLSRRDSLIVRWPGVTPKGSRTEALALNLDFAHYWKSGEWELFDLRADPQELRNLYGLVGQEAVTAELKATLARLKQEVEDDDRFASEQPSGGVDGSVAQLRGR